MICNQFCHKVVHFMSDGDGGQKWLLLSEFIGKLFRGKDATVLG